MCCLPTITYTLSSKLLDACLKILNFFGWWMLHSVPWRWAAFRDTISSMEVCQSLILAPWLAAPNQLLANMERSLSGDWCTFNFLVASWKKTSPIINEVCLGSPFASRISVRGAKSYTAMYSGVQVGGTAWLSVCASLEGSLGPKELRMVMLEFEKCGKIIDHIPGSEGTDWVHIQYQVIIHFRLWARL